MDLLGDKPWVRKKQSRPEKISRSASIVQPSWLKKKRLLVSGTNAGCTRGTATRQSLARRADLRTPRRSSSNTQSPAKKKNFMQRGDIDHELWELLDGIDKSVGKLFPQSVPLSSLEARGPSSSSPIGRIAPQVNRSKGDTFLEKDNFVNRRFNPHVFESIGLLEHN